MSRNAPQMSALWILLFPVSCKIVVFFAVVFEIVTRGVCLYVTTPRATSRKTAPFYFIRIRHSQDIFFVYLFSENHLFVAYFAPACKVFFKDKSDFYHKDLSRVYQKQNLALSWFKPASTLCSKYKWWCEFEKDLKVFRYSFSETIAIFFICFSANILMFYIQKMNCTSHECMAVRINLKNLA